MKATDFDRGTHVRISYYGNTRFAITYKGQGHGRVHKARSVDPANGAPLPDGQEVTCSSRDIIETWDHFIARRPNFIVEQKAAELEAASRQALMEEIKNVCEETAGLLNALGFEAKVSEGSYRYGNDQAYVIVITNPTENQEYLRKQVAEKWGM